MVTGSKILECGTTSKFTQPRDHLIAHICTQMGPDARPVYALEGSIAIAGAAVSWLRDMGFIAAPPEVEKLAGKVKDTGDVYFVPA